LSGNPVRGGRGNLIEHFRIGADGHVADTQYDLVSREEADEERQEGPQYQYGDGQGEYGDGSYGSNGNYGGYAPPGYGGRSYYPNQGWRPGPPPPPSRGLFGNWFGQGYQQPQQPPPPPPTARGFFTPWGQ
jgi:hypothetical protein